MLGSLLSSAMKQRLISFENVTTTPRTYVYYADTLEDLYCFMESEFEWFHREKFDIKVSNSRLSTFNRTMITTEEIPFQFEDLYIKVVPKKKKFSRIPGEILEKIYPTGLLGCGEGAHG